LLSHEPGQRGGSCFHHGREGIVRGMTRLLRDPSQMRPSSFQAVDILSPFDLLHGSFMSRIGFSLGSDQSEHRIG
jgi:hypothetical protein